MAQYVSVNTAQNVKLNYNLAGLGPRILAYLIDGLIKGAYIVVAAILISLFVKELSYSDEFFTVIFFIFALPFIFYSFILEAAYNGQTPGKKALNIKVVRLDGTSPTLGNYFMRWLLRIVDIQLFYGLPAVIAIAASQNGQRLGDMAAGTTVISIAPKVRLSDISLNLPKDEPKAYVPTYPEVIKLHDKDIEIIKQILSSSLRTKNANALKQAADKIKSITGIVNVRQSDWNFLQTIISDYNYYATIYE